MHLVDNAILCIVGILGAVLAKEERLPSFSDVISSVVKVISVNNFLFFLIFVMLAPLYYWCKLVLSFLCVFCCFAAFHVVSIRTCRTSMSCLCLKAVLLYFCSSLMFVVYNASRHPIAKAFIMEFLTIYWCSKRLSWCDLLCHRLLWSQHIKVIQLPQQANQEMTLWWLRCLLTKLVACSCFLYLILMLNVAKVSRNEYTNLLLFKT